MRYAKQLSSILVALALMFLGACTGPEGANPGDESGSESSTTTTSHQPSSVEAPEATKEKARAPVSYGPPMEEGVVLGLEVEVSRQRRATLHGKTNLPDGTILMTSVSGDSTDFLGQDRAMVHEGSFRTDFFGPATGLKDGIYTAGVTMPIPRVQTREVRAIIGEEGEHLTGPLVEQGDLGTTVAVEQKFQIGTDAGVAEERQRHSEAIAKADSILRELRQLVNAGRSMETLRDPDNLDRLRRCGEQMRRNQARAETLRKRAEALPQSLGIHLAIAATSMNRCVSCLPDAIQSCELAGDSLQDAEKAVSEQ